MTVRRSRLMAADPEAVWRVLRDPYHLPRWWPRAERVEGVSPAGWTVLMRTERGHGVRADYVVVEDGAARRSWSLEIAGSPFERLLSEQVTSVQVAPDGRVTLTIRQSGRRFARVGGAMLRRGTVRLLDEALANLAALVE